MTVQISQHKLSPILVKNLVFLFCFSFSIHHTRCGHVANHDPKFCFYVALPNEIDNKGVVFRITAIVPSYISVPHVHNENYN